MPDPSPRDDVLGELEAAGLVARTDGRARTTRRWQAALARAAARLQEAGAPWRDLRLPIAAAMLDCFMEATDDELVRYVEAMLAVELGGEVRVASSSPP
jgi:hypothetical protein